MLIINVEIHIYYFYNCRVVDIWCQCLYLLFRTLNILFSVVKTKGKRARKEGRERKLYQKGNLVWYAK